MSKNPTTRRYSRTLAEAFGPYTSSHIAEPSHPMPAADRLVLAASVLAAVILAALALAGWL